MVNYENIPGISYTRYTDEDSAENPSANQHDARIDEMYFDYGHLHLHLETVDGYLDIEIPVLPMDKWNGFVDTLPKWDDE